MGTFKISCRPQKEPTGPSSRHRFSELSAPAYRIQDIFALCLSVSFLLVLVASVPACLSAGHGVFRNVAVFSFIVAVLPFFCFLSCFSQVFVHAEGTY